MAFQHRIVKVFNIRPEESRAVLYLMTFSFFIGLSMTFYFAAANAIFLKHFQYRMISVSYMASGIIVWTAWWLLSRLDRRLSLPWQLIVKFLFVFVTVAVIGAGVWLYDTPWLVFIMFTWIRVLVYITLVTFWGLAGKLFNIRQGRRVFGLLGIGEVISIIIGYFSVPFLLKFLKAADLLFLSSGALLVCLVIVFVILRIFREQITGFKPAAGLSSPGDNKGSGYRSLIRQPYFLFISLMALLPIFGYLFVDFLFLAQTKIEFANDPESIAGFFGLFLGVVAVVELLFKLLSGRFLGKYGIKASLVSLPLILFAGTLLAAMSGTVYGTAGLFFAFIALSRLFERSVRSSVYEPAFQLLYQPVPSGQRLAFQNQIEGIPKAAGTVITGALILAFTMAGTFSLVHYTWLFIAILGLWIWVSFRMYDQYRSMLKTKLTELKAGSGSGSDDPEELITKSLVSVTPDRFDRLFDTLGFTYPHMLGDIIRGVYRQSTMPRKLQLLNKIAEKQLITVREFLKEEQAVTQPEEMHDMLQTTLMRLDDASRCSYDVLTAMAKSDHPGERLKAAGILGSSGRYETFRLLKDLIRDENPMVRRVAILSGSRTRRTELWPGILDNLQINSYATTAATGLQMIGKPVLPDLERLYAKSDDETQWLIIKICEKAGGERAVKFLRKQMTHPSRAIRKQVLLSLSTLGYRASVAEASVVRNIIEETIENTLWIQASLLNIGRTEEDAGLQVALLDQLEEDKNLIFMLLALLYESTTIHHIRENIVSKDANAKVYALEIADMLIAEDIKQMIFPLFEETTMTERLQRFESRFPQENMDLLNRLYDILNRDNAKAGLWIKSCALGMLGSLSGDGRDETGEVLAAFMVHPHPLIAEHSAWVMSQKDPERYGLTMARLSRYNGGHCATVPGTISNRQQNRCLLLFEKVRVMKNTEIFFYTLEDEIVNLLIHHPETRFLPEGQDIPLDEGLRGFESLKSDNGWSVRVPPEAIHEMIVRSPLFARHYLTSIGNSSKMKDYE